MGAINAVSHEVLCGDRLVFLVFDAAQAATLARHFGLAATIVDLDQQRAHGLCQIRKLRAGFPEMPVIAISRVLGVK